MIRYISDLLIQGQNPDNYTDSKRTYFPTWKFWDRQVRTETSYDGTLTREFDRAGNVICITRKKSMLHQSGFGERFYREKLDLETLTATSQPYPDLRVTVFPTGIYHRVHILSDNCHKVTFGQISPYGRMTPTASVMMLDGKPTDYQLLRFVRNRELWVSAIKAHDLPLESKAETLDKASTAYLKSCADTKDETVLRDIKHSAEKIRFLRHKECVKEILSQVRRGREHR